MGYLDAIFERKERKGFLYCFKFTLEFATNDPKTQKDCFNFSACERRQMAFFTKRGA